MENMHFDIKALRVKGCYWPDSPLGAPHLKQVRRLLEEKFWPPHWKHKEQNVQYYEQHTCTAKQ